MIIVDKPPSIHRESDTFHCSFPVQLGPKRQVLRKCGVELTRSSASQHFWEEHMHHINENEACCKWPDCPRGPNQDNHGPLTLRSMRTHAPWHLGISMVQCPQCNASVSWKDRNVHFKSEHAAEMGLDGRLVQYGTKAAVDALKKQQEGTRSRKRQRKTNSSIS
jgi:hypothetical protein